MDRITEKIKKIREEKGISKAKMSEALEIDPSNYNKYEKNGKDWSITQIQKISSVLGISVIELLNGEVQTVGDSDRVKELKEEVSYWIEKRKQEDEKNRQDFLFMAKMFDRVSQEIEMNHNGDIEKLRLRMSELFRDVSVFFQRAANGESIFTIMESMLLKLEKKATSDNKS